VLILADCDSSTMAAERRMSALSRQLTSIATTGLVPRDIYLWLTRDNVELRDRMLDFLKVSCLNPHVVKDQGWPGVLNREFMRAPCVSGSFV
jgi:hypothetical protein